MREITRRETRKWSDRKGLTVVHDTTQRIGLGCIWEISLRITCSRCNCVASRWEVLSISTCNSTRLFLRRAGNNPMDMEKYARIRENMRDRALLSIVSLLVIG